ncbi:disintegrin and metalloproteinase domain-containing protein 10 isoform X2 [Solea solea]|uniref:disintegrin and metalloproteinase domain-containing protein 10 isoform X2 n=1 Tax=Solea solea TaxID=90069 RepID=UPI00272A4BD7|nr:disintegrin and metalloproteinase domain-containing protein 10 isoform X2 [Solea solea]
MGVQLHWLLLLLVVCRKLIADAVSDISPYIKHHEGLSYDRGDLHKMHLRARRSTQPEEHTLQLDFPAFHKTFRLRLKRNAEAFSQDFMVASENGSSSADLSHIYSGTLEGEHGSVCHGSVLQGQFEGTIHTDDGTYHIEPVHRYTSNHTDHHSIIYHEDHMVLPPMGSNSNGFCGAEHLRVLAQSLRPSDEAPASRSRRTVDESKTSCLLHLHVDHLYYKKFKSVEAVVAQRLQWSAGTRLGGQGNWGGICSKYTTLRNGRMSTLNTGLVTVQNYGQVLPPRLVQLTFAHELGHSLGAPHDEGSNCGDLGSAGGKGKYLMFPQATDGVRENNDKFSHCSIKHISKTLGLKKDDCFVVSDQPICGNHIVEGDEECDVGHDDTDHCCYSAIEPVGVQCHLKPGKHCSPSQGLCCGQDCGFKSADQTCDEETDCLRESVCSGLSPLCPEPEAKENLTVCSEGTRVCLNGECAESVCVKHHLQQCDCPGDSMREKCHMCCQQPDKPETCASTTSSVLSRHFQKKTLPLVGGAPCFGNQGYCDKFHVCRMLDADGPIARLKNSFLHLDDFEDVGEWMKAHWWAILLAILTLSGVMGCTVCLCSQTLNTRDLE